MNLKPDYFNLMSNTATKLYRNFSSKCNAFSDTFTLYRVSSQDKLKSLNLQSFLDEGEKYHGQE